MKFVQFTILTIALVSSFNCVHAQNTVKVNLKFSKFYATYAYLQDLSEYSGDNDYKRSFKASEYNNDENNALIFQFDTLDIDHSYEFQAFPKGDKMPGMTGSILRKNLMNSASLNEFKTRSFGVVTSEELSRFTYIIEHFLPIYDALVFNVNKDDFEVKLTELKSYVDSINISSFFEKSLTFYGSKWDPTIPFDIVIIPSTKKGGFTAEAFMNNAVSEVPMDFPYYDILFAVLLHEIDHILYDEQPLRMKQNLTMWFNANPSKNSRYAYLLMNEALATALGNGYVYEVINGSLDTEEWYNVKYINLMAQQIYPLVKEYLNADKSVDKEFVDRYIAIYDAHFPEWTNELDNVFTYRYLITDEEESQFFFLRNFPYASRRYFESPLNQGALDNMMETPVTKTIIISQNHKKKWTMIKSSIPELAKLKINVKKEFVSTVRMNDGTILFLINVIDTPVDEFLGETFKSGHVNVGTTTEY